MSRRAWNQTGGLVAVVLGVLTLLPPTGAEEEERRALAVGEAGPAWKNLPGTDGKSHSLAELKGKKGVAVIFFANHCPDCVEYLDRVLTLAGDYRDKGIATVLLSVSRMEEDSLEHMTELANKRRFPCDYLKDPSQAMGKAYGAGWTPEVFLLNGEHRLVYHGAFDDHWNPKKVKRPHLRIAIEELLDGKPVSVPETEPKGCFIEYEDE